MDKLNILAPTEQRPPGNSSAHVTTSSPHHLITHLLIPALVLMVAGCHQKTPQSAPAVPHGFVAPRLVAPLFDPHLADQRLEGPERDRWQQPTKIVEALQLRSGATVADVGCGTGYLMPYLSRAVGPTGRVLSEEIQEEFMPGLRQRAKGLGNVEVNLGTAEDPNLLTRNVDTFILLTVYHEVDHPVDFLKALRKYGRPDARLAIIDFDANRHGEPPAPDGHQVAESAVIQEAAAAGWQLTKRHEFIPSQFFLVFRQSGRQLSISTGH